MNFVWLLIATAFVHCDSTARAQSAEAGLRASVSVRWVTSHRQHGNVGSGWVGDDLAAGESARLYVVSGRAADGTPCGAGGGGTGGGENALLKRMAEQQAAAAFVWQFEVKMQEVTTDRITFDLTWDRISHLPSGEAMHETRRITVTEGESYPLDLIHGLPDGDCASFFLDTTARMVEDAALQSKVIDWDLWWTKDPQSEPVRMRLVTRHGGAATFSFNPVPITTTATNGAATRSFFQVSGELRGRVQPDGSIAVTLTTRRTVGNSAIAAAEGSRSGSSHAESGRKAFTLKPDEAVRIVLPPLGRRLQITTSADPKTGERTSASTLRGTAGGDDPTGMSIVVRARVR